MIRSIKKAGAKALAVLAALALCAAFFPASAGMEEGAGYETAAQFSYLSAITGNAVTDGCRYEDAWFAGSADACCGGLALLSAQLSAASGSAGSACALLEKLEFEGVRAVGYDGKGAGCAFVTGTRTIETDGGEKTLAAVVFRSLLYGEEGWIENVTVNGEDGAGPDHAGYAAAARAALEELDAALPGGDTVYWLTGLSRGGALANVAAARLLERDDPAKVFCYTFESPNTTQDPAARGGAYGGIFNYVSADDIVTMLPPWGMARYGQDVPFDTQERDGAIARLCVTGEEARAYAQSAGDEAKGGVEETVEKAMALLEEAVPDREAYSKERTAYLPGGEEVLWDYQDGMRALAALAAGGDFAKLAEKADEVTALLPDIVYARAEEAFALREADPEARAAMEKDAAGIRWRAAGRVCGIAQPLAEGPVRQQDAYALIELLGRLLVDASAAGEELPGIAEFDWMGCVRLDTVMGIAGALPALGFSHMPDVAVARLKLLSPWPKIPKLDLMAAQPRPGDDTGKLPHAVGDMLREGGEEAAEEAGWIGQDGPVLEGGRIAYFRATASFLAQSLRDDMRFTLCGLDPVLTETGYRDGKAWVTAVWSFRLGEPEEVRVSYDTNGRGDPPESFGVEKGTVPSLSGVPAARLPDARDGGGLWGFDGWTDGDTGDWRARPILRDTVLTARWHRILDEIELEYALPRAGDGAAPEARVPEGAPYVLGSVRLVDEEWEDAERIESGREYRAFFEVHPADPSARFPFIEEDGVPVYTGTVRINGKQAGKASVTEYTDDESGEIRYTLLCEFCFTPEG